jgi:hypothetical protein
MESKKTTIQFKQPKVEAPKDSVYRIKKGGGVAYMLPTKAVTVFDEESGNVRSIRYCPAEPSIYVDEQSENPRAEPVIFYDKLLVVPKTKPNLINYLDNHPQNSKNGGYVFEKVDSKKSSSEGAAKEFLVSDAVQMVKNKSINELLPVAIYYGLNVSRDFSEVRYELLLRAKENPSAFIESFDNPSVRTRAIAVQAENYQIISIKNSGAYWFDTNALIVSNPVGMDATDTLVRFLLTEKGSSVLSKLEEELSSL